jgi:hypothetical protein
MPFIRRVVTMRSEAARQNRASFSDMYLRPHEERLPTDEDRDPSPKELADVKARFPEDFEEKKPVKTAEPSRKTVPDHDPLEELSGGAQNFIGLRWQLAVQKVESISDEAVDLLEELYAAEQIRPGGPRQSVLDAFAAKGFGATEE